MPPTPTAVSVEAVRSFDGLASLRESWEELFACREHEPSVSFEWTTAMVRHHVRAGDDCLVLQLRRGSRIVGLIPLVARVVPVRGCPIRMLTPLSEDYNTHSDLLLADTGAETVSAFVSALFNLDVRWDCFRMARLLDDAPLAAGLERALAAQRRWQSVRDGLPAYVLSLPRSYEAYLADRSAKFRNHLKRVERKIGEAGTVVVEEVTSVDQFARAYDALLRVEQASWKHQHGSAISAVERQSGFYRDFSRGALESGRLHLHWLRIGDTAVAYNLGYINQTSYHYLKTSYDAAYRALSPATFLRARLIQELIGRGIATLDFPGEPYEWETQWTHDLRWRRVASVYGSTIRGRALFALDRLRHRPRERRVEHVDPRTAHTPARRTA